MKKMYNNVSRKLKYMGLKINPKVFIYMRFISCIILFLILLLGIDYGFIVAPIVTIAYYMFAEIVILDLGIRRRCLELEEDALEFMPIFLMALKQGRNVKNALVLSTSVINNTLADEFKIVLRDVNIGKSLEEALNMLRSRIPSIIVNNMVIGIMEANRLGIDVNDSINIQLGYIKDKKRKEILSYYKKMPLKFSIISIVFVLIVLVCLFIFAKYL